MQRVVILPKSKRFTEDDYALPLEEQATHADQGAFDACKDVHECERLLDREHHTFERWNGTSLGNAAFLAIHGPTASVRERARQLHGQYVQWRRKWWWCSNVVPAAITIVLMFALRDSPQGLLAAGVGLCGLGLWLQYLGRSL